MSADDFFTGQGSPAAVHRLVAGKSLSSAALHAALKLVLKAKDLAIGGSALLLDRHVCLSRQ